MKRAQKNRLKKVFQQIEALPITRAVEDAAFERFRETGELPEHRRLAGAVVDRALRGGAERESQEVLGMRKVIEHLKRLADDLTEADPEPEPELLRESLFNEAVYGDEVIRIPARAALKVLVGIGRDVTDPQFIPEEVEMPDFGSVGLHVLGFPEEFVRPPYEDQAGRLFEQFASIRERIDRDDPGWSEAYGEAAVRFLRMGELPDDDLMREAAIANGEWVGLLAHTCGQGDPGVMALFNRVGTAVGAEREDAIVELQELAFEGRLVSAPTASAAQTRTRFREGGGT